MIEPGATIGILGTGQLGRMIAMPALRMGYRVRVFGPEADPPAAAVALHHRAPWADLDAVRAFAAACDLVTYEWENVPAATAAAVAERCPLRPSVELLARTQDRLAEHAWLHRLGIPTAPGRPVHDLAGFEAAVDELGSPGRLKSARGGYDGGGQWRVREDRGPARAAVARGGDFLYERDVAFDRELSVIVCRSAGRARCFPIFENQHEDGILAYSRVPAELPARVAEAAQAYALALAADCALEGTLTVECFQVGDEVWVNELAPRVHNSGHLSLEAMATSQFEQHLRAVCGLPLGEVTLLRPAAMANLLGDRARARLRLEGIEALLAQGGHFLHLYGKQEVRARRKLGHVTVLADDADAALLGARRARELLRFGD